MRIFDSRRDRAQLLVLVLGAAVAVAVAPFAPGLLGAGILHVVFAPAHRRLEGRLSGGAATAIVVVAAAVAVIVPGALLAALVVDHVPGLLRAVQGSALVAWLAGLRILGVDLGAQVAAASGALLSWLSRQGLALVGGAVHATVNLTLALFGLYYLLRATPGTWARVADALPFSRATAAHLGARFRSVTEAMLVGVVLTAALQGTIVGLGFRLVGLPDALFWGVVTAFASVLPLFGSALVWVPGALALLATGRPGAALALVAIGAGVASSIDNVMRPFVYRRVSHIHPMTTLVGAFAGVAAFGVLGVLIGPLAISYAFELMRAYRAEYGAAEPAAAALEMAAAPRDAPRAAAAVPAVPNGAP